MPHAIVPRICPTCHKGFVVLLKRVNQPGRGVYCKPACVPQRQIRGEKSWLYRRANPEAVAAHRAVALAVESGAIVKAKTCERCKRPKRLDAHHDDYGQPLVVRWLCRGCHLTVHGERKKAA